MKISELVKELEAIKYKHGDVRVSYVLYDDDERIVDLHDVQNVALIDEHAEQCIQVMIS